MIPRCLISLVSWKSVSILTIVAAVLQAISLVLSWYERLLPSSNIKNASILQDTNQQLTYQQFLMSQSSILTKINQWSLLDTSGEFKFATGILKGTDIPSHRKKTQRVGANSNNSGYDNDMGIAVTLVTHCSINHLHLLPTLIEQWQGPVSIAVFLHIAEVESAVQSFLQLHRCFPSIKANVTFSIVYPLTSPTSLHILERKRNFTPCEDLIIKLSNHSKEMNYFSDIPYPNNLLRNVAHKTVQTAYMMTVDIDMVPNINLHSSFVNFALKNGLVSGSGTHPKSGQTFDDKVVWVVPSYEIRNDVDTFPQSKEDILHLKKKGLIRPFYEEVCWKCQYYTNYNAWENFKDSQSAISNNVKPIYEVFWQDPWEPFYISSVDVPSYDERFRQYGYNRISQVCELHVSGHRFLVLDSAFLVHRGFKDLSKFHPSKDLELGKNQILLRQFKSELKEKYPESSRHCY